MASEMVTAESDVIPSDEYLPKVEVKERANLGVWNALKATAKRFTKKVRFGKREFTAISPHWQLFKATCLWGPYGDRWGLAELEYERNDIAADPHPVPIMVLKAKFFYTREDGTRVFFSVAVDTPYKAGDDTYKKLQTAARSKALSLIGCDAGVFLGLFDDVGYVEQVDRTQRDQLQVVAQLRDEITNTKKTGDLDVVKARIHSLTASEGLAPHDGTMLLEYLGNRRAVLENESGSDGK